MANEHPNDPLHGITLETMLRKLVNKYGWDGLAKRIRINCLKNDPTISSVLNFLRKTPWARAKVEELYSNSKFWTRDEVPE
ncbi:MAG: VF530 family protein [Actinomycetota bacterium]|nr:VF530 family protein [Actinomycetota bacterium]MDZ4180087.1 VF530 family protein [Coriobacteriia bacterium]